MSSKKDIVEDEIRKIREGLDETNGAHQPAINQHLDGLINMLKKYILVRQTKLDKYIAKLQERKNDDLANSLLENINAQLIRTGEKYGYILKLESDKKP